MDNTKKMSRALLPGKRSAEKTSYTIYEDERLGSTRIQNSVLASIAAVAATETEGVTALAGGITHAKATRISAKMLSKGVKIEVEDRMVSVRIILNIGYGFNIPEVTRNVQEKVKTSIENMTGLSVAVVDVSVSDVTIDPED